MEKEIALNIKADKIENKECRGCHEELDSDNESPVKGLCIHCYEQGQDYEKDLIKK